MIPFDLLGMAMQLTGTQEFLHLPYLSRYTTETGVYVSVYDTPVSVRGQVQAVPRELFEKLGLELQKQYLVFYISQDILDIARDIGSDKISYANETYQCLSKTDWFAINGWVGVIAVKLPGGFIIQEGGGGFILTEGSL